MGWSQAASALNRLVDCTVHEETPYRTLFLFRKSAQSFERDGECLGKAVPTLRKLKRGGFPPTKDVTSQALILLCKTGQISKRLDAKKMETTRWMLKKPGENTSSGGTGEGISCAAAAARRLCTAHGREP